MARRHPQILTLGLCVVLAGCSSFSSSISNASSLPSVSSTEASSEASPSSEISSQESSSLADPGTPIDEDTSAVTPLEDKYRNFYEIFVGSFYDANGDGKGDLKGVEAKLDYLYGSGYTGIWLMPIFSSPSYHKYNTTDYYAIDPAYGTIEDLKSLIAACHQKKMTLILDLAMNHSSKTCAYYQNALAAHVKAKKGETLTTEESAIENLYSWSDDFQSGYSYAYGDQNFTFFVESNFSDDMPEFNFDNPQARTIFKDVAKYYYDLGIDGFRLDAVKYYYYKSTLKTIEWLKEFSSYCHTLNPASYLVGECWSEASEIQTYYGSGLDSLFNFPSSMVGSNALYKNINMDGILCANYVDNVKQLLTTATGAIPAPFLDNHDMGRVGRKNEGQCKFVYGLLAMMNGAAFTYYGDELGVNGTTPPDENVRCYMPWGEGSFPGKCQNPDGGKDGYINPPLSTQSADPSSIYAYYKKANYLRNKFPLIARGSLKKADADADKTLVVLEKEEGTSSLKLILNFSSSVYRNYPLSTSEKVVGQLLGSRNTYIGSLASGEIVIPPYGIAVVA